MSSPFGLPRLTFENVRGDLFGGVTAAVVALPLALAFGVASGAGAAAGLWGAIVLGLVSALFGGTPTQVSGPTGPMTVVSALVLFQYQGSPGLACAVFALGGLLQVAFGWLRLGRYVTYVPFPVISGFMTGVGVIIIVLQLGPALGHAASDHGVIAALTGLPAQFADIGAPSFGLAALALAVMYGTPKRLRAVAPPPLLALLVGTVVSIGFSLDVSTIGAIPRGLPELVIPAIDVRMLPDMFRFGLILALLGTVDSLLTSLVADSMTRTQHDSDRELAGQGLGNVLVAMVGGIPGAGATMRTVVNVRAGGRTSLSGVVHAVTLLGMVLGLAPLAERIPNAVLAGILLKVGLDIVDWTCLKRLPRMDRSAAVVMLTVLVLTVLVDLITAVAVGVIMKSLISASRLSSHQLAQLQLVGSDGDITPLTEDERVEWRRADGRVLVVHLSGPFSFASARELVRRAAVAARYQAVVFNFADVRMIDTSVAMAIEEVVRECVEAEHVVVVAGLDGEVGRSLERLGILALVPAANRRSSRLEALRYAVDLLDAGGPSAGHEPAAS